MLNGFRLTRLLALVALLAACGDSVGPEPDIRIVVPFNEVRVGTAMQLSVRLAGSSEPVPAEEVQWSSSSPGVVEVFENGGAIARRIGVANITATAAGLSAVAQIRVVPSYILRVLHISTREVYPTGLNNAGHVVAWVDTATNEVVSQESFLWTTTERVSLGAGQALALNDANDVVGVFGSDAVLWTGSQRLTVFTRAGGEARATGINNHGAISGHWRPTDAECDPCLHDVFFGTLGSVSVVMPGLLEGTVRSMNQSGWSVGSYAKPERPGDLFPFLYRDGERFDLLPENTPAIAMDINEAGDIVGYDDDGLRLWTQTDPVTLDPAPPSACGVIAEGINDLGEIVGTHDCVATLWRHGEPINLQELHGFPGWTVTRAIRINENGQILGYAVESEGTLRAVVLLDPL